MDLNEKKENYPQSFSQNVPNNGLLNGQINSSLPTREITAINSDQPNEGGIAPPPAKKSRKILLFSIIAILLILVLGGGIYLFVTRFAKDALAETFKKMSSITSYTNEITIDRNDNGQETEVTGIVDVDIAGNKAKGHLESSSKANDQEAKFSMDTIVINKTVYTKASTSDSIFSQLLPKEWLRVDAENLPEEIKKQIELNRQYTSDNLSVFFEEGKSYISVQKKEDDVSGAQKLIHYTLTLSPSFLDKLNENQKTFFEELSKGSLEIWINADSFLTEKVIFESPEGKYTSVIKNVNQPLAIEPPASSITYDEFQSQAFSSFLSKTPVQEVFIGYYGNIYPATIDKIKKIIEESFGIKVTLLGNNKQTFPKKDPFYDSKRKQFDSDYIWQSLSTLSAQYGQSVRQLFITDVDLFTKIQPERSYVFSRSLPDANTALISINRLMNVSDESKNQASSEIFGARLKKVVMRTLGVTVGLSLAPSSSDQNCIMYQFQNLEELDKTGGNFCEDQKAALKKVFVSN